MTNTPNDDFDWTAAESDLAEQARSVVASETVNVQLLSDIELLDRFQTITDELRDRSEMLRPTTETGRDLQSMRAACSVELRRRGLLG